jgi:hypothetical protein
MVCSYTLSTRTERLQQGNAVFRLTRTTLAFFHQMEAIGVY